MNFKQFNTSDNQWHDVPYYIHNTSTDTITTLPADIYANTTTATVGLKGDMSQSSTPTPTNPIQPSECGERTGNLFDKTTMAVNAYLQKEDGIYRPSSSTSYSCLVKIKPNTSYIVTVTSKTFRLSFVSHKPQSGSIPTAFYDDDHDTYETKTLIKTSGSADVYMVVFCYSSSVEYSDGKTLDEIMSTVMISEGSEMAVPYEPYGYKIPILSNSITTPVYLGEMQSTRQIKKLVLDGTENWKLSSTTNQFYIDTVLEAIPSIPPTCTHFKGVSSLSGDNQIVISASQKINIRTTYIQHNLTDWIAYLQQQYANGTPVTVWYVLAEPETGIVNEPLRKIGTYADEISGISIPTIAGANTLSIGTTLQPSEVSATYKGWHPVQSVHERESGQWD